ncbi:hypothetical protein BU26DRAFT_231199 [Trematosphaeria pertusa]|uniref:Uncharacterized protein n=1 Tax=Trematosphaeria pertusa TaxID=390896 RepID=A0A6A6IXH0_9PLEO|nr:uncharacterized protein BU26DRAFT_231199 [Trematosphaeria pertusa]KAF2253883.1 hypothetical protein BU26DRAFT_231199 [Trematosphaeria pertusa]
MRLAWAHPGSRGARNWTLLVQSRPSWRLVSVLKRTFSCPPGLFFSIITHLAPCDADFLRRQDAARARWLAARVISPSPSLPSTLLAHRFTCPVPLLQRTAAPRQRGFSGTPERPFVPSRAARGSSNIPGRFYTIASFDPNDF